jgi:hypothetical protein
VRLIYCRVCVYEWDVMKKTGVMTDLLTCPPGFKSNIRFERRKFDGILSSTSQSSVISITDILSGSIDFDLASPVSGISETRKPDKVQVCVHFELFFMLTRFRINFPV